MSAISTSVGSSLHALLAQQNQRQRIDGDRGGQGPGGAQFASRFAAAAKAVGVNPGKVSDLQSQVQAAIKDASKNGPPSQQAVRDAVNGVLKQNGIDPAKFEAALQSQGAGTRHHHRVGGASHAKTSRDGATSASQTLVGSLNAQETGTGSLLDVAA
jgi:hypothetical protein